MNTLDFKNYKLEGRKISMVTCYDSTLAKILNESPIDSLLVGDSVAMVVHGHSSTVAATTEMMALHTSAVVRGAPSKFVIADMPFLSVRKGLEFAMNSVELLIRAGAQAVKIENLRGHESILKNIVESGVPVMGHLGLTPQSVHAFGGFRVQGRDDAAAIELLRQSQELESLGCFALVLECVPSQLATRVATALKIPVIGIGAGSGVDGQVLVSSDLLGMNADFKPKFLKHYSEGHKWISQAFKAFDSEVKQKMFPSEKESY